MATDRGKAAHVERTSARGYADNRQNSNWQMCQRGGGKAMNSFSRTATDTTSQQKALHIRARLRKQEPKQQLADVPKRRRDGDELVQPKSIRARQGNKTRCTAERSCTDKNQNSNWQMCQRGVGMAMNSVSRTASERGKSAQRRCTAERSCTDKNQKSNWRMCQRGVGKATNSVGRTYPSGEVHSFRRFWKMIH